MLKLIAILLIVTATTSAFAQITTPKKIKAPARNTAKKATPVAVNKYECPDCHDKFTVARATKTGMMCTCCQAKLVALKPAPAKGKKATGKKS